MGSKVRAGKGTLTANDVFYKPAKSNCSANYRDITSGTNGTCGALTASSSYDYVTGLGRLRRLILHAPGMGLVVQLHQLADGGVNVLMCVG